MAEHERKYFYINQLAKRWGSALEDIRYYAENGELEMQVWLGDIEITRFNYEERDKEPVTVYWGAKKYNDFAIIEPLKVRDVFRSGNYKIKEFVSLDRKYLLTLKDINRDFYIAVDDLIVSHQERDRFENKYDLYVPSMKIRQLAKIPTFAGRPSIMRQIIAHLEERIANQTAEPSLGKEAAYLHNWANAVIPPDVQIPQPRSIMNGIRKKYRNYALAMIANNEQNEKHTALSA